MNFKCLSLLFVAVYLSFTSVYCYNSKPGFNTYNQHAGNYIYTNLGPTKHTPFQHYNMPQVYQNYQYQSYPTKAYRPYVPMHYPLAGIDHAYPNYATPYDAHDYAHTKAVQKSVLYSALLSTLLNKVG